MITDPKTWNKVNQAENQKRGRLITVEKSPGHFVKMYEADALRLGYIKPQPAQGNKMRPAEGNKAENPSDLIVDGEQSAAEELITSIADEISVDFSAIAGLGPASARALELNGITTFEQLKKATNLDFLPQRAQTAIEKWRTGA